MKRTILILIIITLIISDVSFAHPGRTDSSGCHACRTNCSSWWGLSTGEYHRHRSKSVSQPIEPVRSIRNKNGAGKTVPAPEYKIPVSNTVVNAKVNTISSSLIQTKNQIYLKDFLIGCLINF